MGLLQQLFRKKHRQYNSSERPDLETSTTNIKPENNRSHRTPIEPPTSTPTPTSWVGKHDEGETVDYTADDDHLESAAPCQPAEALHETPSAGSNAYDHGDTGDDGGDGSLHDVSNETKLDEKERNEKYASGPSLASDSRKAEHLGVPALVYLTEDHEHGEDTISVVSDVRTAEELAEELSELSKAIQALEVETQNLSPEFAVASQNEQGTEVVRDKNDGQQFKLDRESGMEWTSKMKSDANNGPLLGSSPARSSSTIGGESYSRNMTKLYNDLALRLMDVREYDQALAMLQKAEVLLDTDASWKSASSSDGGGNASTSHQQRDRLRSITYNNIGCLYKRRAMPQEALAYLHKALTLESAAGDVHNSASTHLNLSAAYSALSRFGDALWHAERAIIILQRQLWGATCSFQDGVIHASRLVASIEAKVAKDSKQEDKNDKSDKTVVELKRTQRQLLANANILCMAYYNAAVENERLGKLREAQVSYHRATTVGHRFLPQKSATMLAITKAQKAFLSRQQQRNALSGGAGGSSLHTSMTHPSRNKSSVMNTGPGKGSVGSSKSKFLSGGTVMSTATWTSRNSSLTEKKSTKNRRG
jgi:tetratricopeptide (TPR) repeat protein